MPRNNTVHGFTLMEVLVSMFILSLMSVAALSSFQQMIHAKEIQKSHERVLTSLSFAYTTCMNDLAQQVDDDTPVTFNEREIMFVRAWQGGEQAQDTIEVRYTWSGNGLMRELQSGEESTSHVLLNEARNIQWQWLSDDTWHDVSVPLATDKKVRAFKLTFLDPMAGEITWIFAHP